VSGRIIETAVTNKTLHLDLDYREPSMLPEGDVIIEGPMTDTGLPLQYGDPQVSGEFACFLRVICEEGGEFS
jgi:hypothetical protein